MQNKIFTMDLEKDIRAGVLFAKWLNQNGLQGEFYVCGNLVKKYPKQIKFIGKNHILCGHGYYHEDFAKLSKQKVRSIINKTIQVFKQNGLCIRGWRFPYLSYSNYALNYVVKCGLYDSSIRENVWVKWGRLSFIRNWLRNLLRGIITFPYYYSNKLDEKCWRYADLNEKDLFNHHLTKKGRLIFHCWNFFNKL